jgi:hypothetical protein
MPYTYALACILSDCGGGQLSTLIRGLSTKNTMILLAVSDRDVMTYGFFLKIMLSPYGRFLSEDSSERPLVLPEPIGAVQYRGSPRGTPVSEASAILFIGSQYGTNAAAESVGQRLKAVVQLASLDAGIAIDAGNDEIRGGPGQVMIDSVAEQGVLLLHDVHGLQVFEETGQHVQLSGNAVGYAGSPLAAFENAMIIRARHTKDFDEKHALATQLHGISRFETSQRSRLLTLVTALDVLSQKKIARWNIPGSSLRTS